MKVPRRFAGFAQGYLYFFRDEFNLQIFQSFLIKSLKEPNSEKRLLSNNTCIQNDIRTNLTQPFTQPSAASKLAELMRGDAGSKALILCIKHGPRILYGNTWDVISGVILVIHCSYIIAKSCTEAVRNNLL